jgi:hypothetical protein
VTLQDVMSGLKKADPVEASAVEAWINSPACRQTLDSILEERAEATPVVAPGRGPGRAPALVAIAVAVVLMVAGGIAGAAVLLGRPAPEQVKKDIRAVDTGLPNEIRLNPDVTNARSVASSESSTLYLADLKDGGHCTEIVDGRGTGASVCTTGQQVGSLPIDITVPFVSGSASTLTVGGRVNAETATDLAIRYADGSEDPIPFGEDHYFLFDVPASKLDLARSAGFELIARDATGAQVAKGVVPPDFDSEPGEETAPIYVSTISTGDDFTKVLGIEGIVNAKGAVSLELRYPDGTVVRVPIANDGSYRLDLPADRQDDLYPNPGTLIARDSHGNEVARTVVAAVAYWRAQERSSGAGG